MATFDNDDDNGIFNFLATEAVIGRIKSECDNYLDGTVFQNQIRLGRNEYDDKLEMYAPVGSTTIQKIIDQYQQIDTIHIRNAPTFLPIIVSKIAEDNTSYIIPSEILDIHTLFSHAPNYQLEAVICEINQHQVIFMKDLSTDQWYYYQKNKTCQALGNDLSGNLNDIIQSGSTNEQKRLIKSAHFLISLIFFNAIKYIYKQER